MNQIQRLVILGTLLSAANELDMKTDITALEASKLQVKLLELMESYGGQGKANEITEVEMCKVIRALYNDIMNDPPEEPKLRVEFCEVKFDEKGGFAGWGKVGVEVPTARNINVKAVELHDNGDITLKVGDPCDYVKLEAQMMKDAQEDKA